MTASEASRITGIPAEDLKTLTIWPRYTNVISGLIKPMRRVLLFCSWNERSITTALTTGIVLREPAVIRVFNETSGLKYIPPHEWSQLAEDELDGFWTCDLLQSAKPLIAPFESDYEFSFASSAQTTILENNFRRDNPGATTVSQRNDNSKQYGGHIRLQAGA